MGVLIKKSINMSFIVFLMFFQEWGNLAQKEREACPPTVPSSLKNNKFNC